MEYSSSESKLQQQPVAHIGNIPLYVPPPPREQPGMPTGVALEFEQAAQVRAEQARQQSAQPRTGSGQTSEQALQRAAARLDKLLVSRRVETLVRAGLLLLLLGAVGLLVGGPLSDQYNYLNYGTPRQYRFDGKLHFKQEDQGLPGIDDDRPSEVRIKNAAGRVYVEVDPGGQVLGVVTKEPLYLGEGQDKTPVTGKLCLVAGATYPQIQVEWNGKHDYVVNDGLSVRWAKTDEKLTLSQACLPAR